MAKKQTFTSKLSKQGNNFKYVKHIKSVKSEDTGHTKFLENMVRLEENENLDQALKRMEEESKQVLSFGEVLEEASTEEQPTEEAPVEETPAEEESKEEAPVEEPAEETPAEQAEPATEDESAEQAEESSDK